MIIFGTNITKAMANAVKPNTNTAAAAVSLAILASGFISSVIKSIVASILVFISSVAITRPIVKNITNHSIVDILNIIPAIITKIVASVWTKIFCS